MAQRRPGHRPPRRSAAPRWRRWALLAVALVLGLGGLWLARRGELRDGPEDGPGGETAAPPSPAREGVRERPPARGAEREGPAAPPAPAPPAAGPDRPAGHVALVIDDLGRGLEELAALAALDVPLSYSVLPFEERTAEVVARLREGGAEILCHLPMQGATGADPGPGALLAGMPGDGLAGATRSALARVPGAVGVNNHMGSTLTADPAAMGMVLRVLQQEGLFFLDSRTTVDTVGYSLARSLGLPAAQRDVFLDDDPQPAAVREQFRRLLDRSRERGAAIAIAHPHPSTLAVLREEVPRARAEGFTFVPVSFLLDRTGDPL